MCGYVPHLFSCEGFDWLTQKSLKIFENIFIAVASFTNFDLDFAQNKNFVEWFVFPVNIYLLKVSSRNSR